MSRERSKMPATESQEGFLRWDQDDGWILDLRNPGDSLRIKDLFHEFDGKKVRVTIKALKGKRDEADEV